MIMKRHQSIVNDMKDVKDIPKENLEIERKFLIKRFSLDSLEEIPGMNFIMPSGSVFYYKGNGGTIEVLNIIQYYFNVDGKNLRFRTQSGRLHGDIKFFQTEKHPISKGVFEEIEKELDKEEFMKIFEEKKNTGSYIKKTRYAIKYSFLKWEVDVYENVNLITLEVELDDIDQEIEIPEFLKDLIIKEVTGEKEFSNYNLSSKFGE